MSLPSVRLFFQEGTSDKLYHAEILADGAGFTVKVEWGRRGSRLNQGNKAVRVSLSDAQKVFDRLVREKTSKGYQVIADDVGPAPVAPPLGQGSGSKVSGGRAKVGWPAQLLNPIEPEELDRFLDEERYLAQQKLDGQRVLAHLEDELIPTNRNGQRTEVTLSGLDYLPRGTVLDGELLATPKGPEYWIFDVLKLDGRDLRNLGYEDRWNILDGEIEPGLSRPSCVLPIAVGRKRKRMLFESLRSSGAEGIVFKDRKAPYQAGRPASGGPQRKHKLIKSADVVIMANAGNAYQMAVATSKGWMDVGKVFAGTTNASRKTLDRILGEGGTPVVEVNYLYATDDRQLYQPVFLRIRDDKAPEDCGEGQLVQTNRGVIL